MLALPLFFQVQYCLLACKISQMGEKNVSICHQFFKSHDGPKGRFLHLNTYTFQTQTPKSVYVKLPLEIRTQVGYQGGEIREIEHITISSNLPHCFDLNLVWDKILF